VTYAIDGKQFVALTISTTLPELIWRCPGSGAG
jgi:hypothetical protein